MNLYIKILEEDLEAWMNRYDSELERRENKIIQMKYEKDQQEEEMKRLTQLVSEKNVNPLFRTYLKFNFISFSFFF